MKIYSSPALFFALLLVLGCKENQKEPAAPGNKPRTDSNAMLPSQEVTANPYAIIDISPMDMSYFPVDYTKLKMADSVATPPVMRVIYSRPHLAKRHLFHDLLKYGEPWRLGANESTEIDFYQPVTIQGKRIAPGRYILYCVPHEDSWTIVLNSNIDTWGLRQDPSKDVQRFTIPITTDNPPQEYFTLVFEKAGPGANLVMAWDKVVAKLPVSF